MLTGPTALHGIGIVVCFWLKQMAYWQVILLGKFQKGIEQNVAQGKLGKRSIQRYLGGW